MPCYRPLLAWRTPVDAGGKRGITFRRARRDRSEPSLGLPCGKCIGCRLERSRQMATRCMQEASCHEENSFITLTYDEEHLPQGGTLVKADFQKFMKRLRSDNEGKTIRFFACGEYGDRLGRPHYHACLFGHGFQDKSVAKKERGFCYYRSDSLQKLWPFGQSMIGDVTFESAAYVARYCLKKINGENAGKHYGGKLPEFTLMSRRPGIGRPWIDKWMSDVYPADSVIVRGMEAKPSRYYDNVVADGNPELMEMVKDRRKHKMLTKLAFGDRNVKRFVDLASHPVRIGVRERVALSKITRLARTWENEK